MRAFTFKTLKTKYGGQIEHVLGLNEQQLEQDLNSHWHQREIICGLFSIE
ncbi:MAG: hypothetical protein AB3N14_01300 [Flavobacteriaceae bacterium]